MARKTNQGYFILRRIDLLLGIFPIWFFLLFYLYLNSAAFQGPAAFNKMVSAVSAIPLVSLLEVIFILVPVLFHAVLGLIIFYTGKNNFLDYAYPRNIVYFLYRLTGVVAFVFIIVHTWGMHIQPALDGKTLTFSDVHRIFSSLWIKIFYTIGIFALMYHFTVNVCEALVAFGVTVSRRAQKISLTAATLLAFILSIWGVAIMARFFWS